MLFPSVIVWPSARPRIDLFYITRSLEQRTVDVGIDYPPDLEFNAAHDEALVSAICAFQNVKERSEIPDYKQQLFEDILELCVGPASAGSGKLGACDDVKSRGIDKYKVLKTHFEKVWLADHWLRTCTLRHDVSLPFPDDLFEAYWTDLCLPGEQAQSHGDGQKFVERTIRASHKAFLGYQNNGRWDLRSVLPFRG